MVRCLVTNDVYKKTNELGQRRSMQSVLFELIDILHVDYFRPVMNQALCGKIVVANAGLSDVKEFSLF